MVLDLTIHQDTFNSFKLKSADVRKVYYIVRCFRIHVALRLLLMSNWLTKYLDRLLPSVSRRLPLPYSGLFSWGVNFHYFW